MISGLCILGSLATKTETMNPVVKFAVAVLVDDDMNRHRWKPCDIQRHSAQRKGFLYVCIVHVRRTRT